MKRSKYFAAVLAAAMYVAAFSHLSAQSSASFNRTSPIDVLHYKIQVSFDRADRKVFGDTTVSLQARSAPIRSVRLDAVNLKFETVTLEPSGKTLSHRVTDGSVDIDLDRDYRAGERLAIRFRYSATPKKGVYFVSASQSGSLRHSSQIWTQGEPEEARHWFPSFDFPSDKATTEQIITAEADQTVIGNGALVDKRTSSDGSRTTWHYRMSVPHSTYLVSFIVGKYSRLADTYRAVPLGYYIYPGSEAIASRAFGDTPRMMEFFEGVTGLAYPFEKYDQTVVAKFTFGGMENITATTMSDDEIFFVEAEDGQRLVNNLVSHELAHSWFGNLVTCRNWAELWLNEGFATFMEAAYIEKTQGREAYMRKIQSDAFQFLAFDAATDSRHSLFNRRARDVNTLFDIAPITYNKGSVVLHMLREELGSDVFWRGVKAYIADNKFASVESGNLLRSMESASGADLDWFFDQWVYSTGAPRIELTPRWSESSRILTLRFVQTHKATQTTPQAFRLPITVAVTMSEGTTEHTFKLSKRSEEFTIKLDAQPTAVNAIPHDGRFEDRAPAKQLKVRGIAPLR